MSGGFLIHPSYLRVALAIAPAAREGAEEAGPPSPPETAASLPALERLAGELLRRSGDPALGLALGARLSPLGHGPLGVLLASAPTLRRAFEDLARFAALRAPLLAPALARGGGDLWLSLPRLARAPQLERVLVPALAVLLERLCELLLGESPAGIVHEFPWAPPPRATAYARALRGALRFGAARYALRLPAALADRPLPGADPEAHRLARDACARLLTARGRAPGPRLAEEVERLLWSAEWRWPGLAAVARALGRSPRSLQRALAAEGEGFRAIRERVRAERARELLGAGGLPVGLVAERLGYRDPGNFARSVRRWTGTLPRALRPKRAARAATSAEPPDAPRAGGARRGPASSPRGATAPRRRGT